MKKNKELFEQDNPLKLSKADKLITKNKIKVAPQNIFFRPLNFSRFTLIIFGIIFGVILILLLINFVFLIKLNSDIKKDFAALEESTDKKIAVVSDSIDGSRDSFVNPSESASPLNQNQNNTTSLLDLSNKTEEIVASTTSELTSTSPEIISEPIKTKTTTPPTGGVINSFGDGFSGLTYINKIKTTMYWDENVTAFSFPPLYSFKKIGAAENINSDSNNIALKVINNELYYQGKKISLPAELRSENILNINVSLIANRWLVGIVSGKTYDERGWVYFFDSKTQRFSALITATSAEQIKIKYEKLGGTIAFGGTEDNFLIVYGGYNGHALYYYKGALKDVSDFFGLRVSDGGFIPEIISKNNSRGTIFYLCSKTEGKPKLIKFWPKRAGELMGALDFSQLIFPKTLGEVKASCRTNGEDIVINLKKNNNTSEAWRFIDNGFDNKQDREVVSFDLGRNRGKKIASAAILNIDIASDESEKNNAYNSKFELFFATSINNWQKIEPYNWEKFAQPTESLFWRATFNAEPGYPDYSPWFSNINQLNYQTY